MGSEGEEILKKEKNGEPNRYLEEWQHSDSINSLHCANWACFAYCKFVNMFGYKWKKEKENSLLKHFLTKNH